MFKPLLFALIIYTLPIMNKKIFSILVILALLFPLALKAEEDEDVKELPTRERIFLGGNIGLQISNINTMVVVSPIIGYRLTSRLSPGIGLTYQYYRDSGWANQSGFSAVTHIYGGSAFARYRIFPQLFAHVEFEALNLDSQMGFRTEPDRDSRFWEYNYFVGGGYRAFLGGRTHINLMLLYNLNNSSVVYYQNPIFRIGVDVRL